MRTKLSLCASSLAESAWLTGLALVPVFFNPNSVRIFDEDKALLLRSLALVSAAALIIWLFEQGRTVLDDPPWRLPLVKPAVVLTSALLVASGSSIAPGLSFAGAYVRLQGFWTWTSYIIVFLALLILVRERGQVERVVTVILLASAAPAIYGVCQHFGMDPIRWAIDTRARVISTAGNAIFIGAYMIMVIPLTLTRLMSQAALVRTRREGEKGTAAILLLAYTVLLGLQLLTLLYSESRGPFLGLAAGLTCFFVVYAVHRRGRALLAWTVSLIAAVALFLVVFNLPGSPLASWRGLPYVGRIGQLLETQGGTGKVRVLIWEGASRLLAAHPERLLFGHGPDAMFLAYPPFYPPELSYYERRGVAPDRSHNESFDTVIMSGVVGLMAWLAVYLTLFANAFTWLGMVSSRRQRACLLTLMIGGGVSGVVLPWALDGRIRFSGIGLPVGIIAGVLGYAIGRALLRSAPAEKRGDDLVLIGLVSAIVAHFVEVHFGIAITVTRLYFWIYVALIVVLGAPLLKPRPSDAPASTPLLSGELSIVGVTVGLLLASLSFGFYRPDSDPWAVWPMLATVLGGTWLMGACLIGSEPGQTGSRGTAMMSYTATTGGLLLLCIGALTLWGNVRSGGKLNPELVRDLAHRTVRLTSFVYGFILALVGLQAAIHALRQRSIAQRWVTSPVAGIVAALLIALALTVAVECNLRPARADVLAKQGQIAEARGQLQAARLLYEDAIALEANETTYAVNLARVLTELARRAPREDWSAREEALQRAERVLERAQEQMPLHADHPRNLAILHRAWASLSQGEIQLRHIQQAAERYQRAISLSPQRAELRNEWATLHLEQRDAARALELIDQSLAVDNRYAQSWYLRAEAHVALHQSADALADYDRALAADPAMLAAWSGKALALAEVGRTQDAITANLTALALAPNDLITNRNLALLYQRAGDAAQARQYAEAALLLARGEDREQLERFVRALALESKKGIEDQGIE